MDKITILRTQIQAWSLKKKE